MATGRPRSMSTRTGLQPPRRVNTHRLSWPESTSHEYPSTPRTAGPATRSSQRGHNQANTFANLRRSSGTASRRDRGSQNDSNSPPRMRGSPTRSLQRSSKNEKSIHHISINAQSVRSNPRTSARAVSPMRQDSAYESIIGYKEDGSRLYADTLAENTRERERLEILRGRVLRTRRDIGEKRVDVQTLRDGFRDATDKLVQAINHLISSDTPGDARVLLPYYDQVRDAQNQLGPAEDDYDILELQLNREETELEQEEKHFYNANEISFDPVPGLKLDEPLSPLFKPYQPEDIEFEHLDLDNELVKQYLVKVSEAEHLNEHLSNLENEQYRLSQELSFRTRHNYPVSAETSSFLFEFPELHKNLEEQLSLVEEQLYKLRDRCIDEKLFTPEEHIYTPRDPFIEEINDSIHEILDVNPLHVALSRTNKTASLQGKFKDKREFINTWLLQMAQDSSLEIIRLRDCMMQYPMISQELDDDRWSDLALEFWDHDNAGEYTVQKHNISTMGALAGRTDTSLFPGGSLGVDVGNDGILDDGSWQSMDSSGETEIFGKDFSGETSSESWKEKRRLRERDFKKGFSITQARSV